MFKTVSTLIKYTGNKRLLAPEILSYYPKSINTHIEPFCGTASITLSLIANNWDIKYYLISDINTKVIDLYKLCRSNPNLLKDYYKKLWQGYNKEFKIEQDLYDYRKDFFYRLRDLYNKTNNPVIFLFLTRTCTNGLIRFNSKGGFNASCHFNRPGINPEKLNVVIDSLSQVLNRVEIRSGTYAFYTDPSAFYFLDPPYINTDSMYTGSFNHTEFFKWLKNKNNFLLTFNSGYELEGYKYVDLRPVQSSDLRKNKNKSVIRERMFFS